MIDTVCLLIPKDKITSLDLTKSGVPSWSLQSKTEQYEKFVKNPSKKDLDSGLYFPRLTGYKRKGFAQDAKRGKYSPLSKSFFEGFLTNFSYCSVFDCKLQEGTPDLVRSSEVILSFGISKQTVSIIFLCSIKLIKGRIYSLINLYKQIKEADKIAFVFRRSV